MLLGQGDLRAEPFPLRVYKEYLTEYKLAPELRAADRKALETELKSNLPNGSQVQVCAMARIVFVAASTQQYCLE